MAKWVESAGGPLMVMPQELSRSWNGYSGHYELACEVDEVELLPVDMDGQVATVLVLLGEPMAATVTQDLIVQWRFGDSEGDLLQFVARQTDLVEWTVLGRWHLDGPLRIFDAACPGGELSDGDSIEFDAAAVRHSSKSLSAKKDRTRYDWYD